MAEIDEVVRRKAIGGYLFECYEGGDLRCEDPSSARSDGYPFDIILNNAEVEALKLFLTDFEQDRGSEDI